MELAGNNLDRPALFKLYLASIFFSHTAQTSAIRLYFHILHSCAFVHTLHLSLKCLPLLSLR